MPDPLSWLLIVICILLSFFFSASETALACCNRFKMQIKADEGNKSAKRVLKTLEKFDRALTTVLIGNNIVAIAVSSIATVFFIKYFGNKFDDTTISIVVSIVMSFIVYIIGDTLPKTIAKAIPDTICLAFIYPITWLTYLFFPFVLLLDAMAKLFEKIFKIKKEEALSEEDLETAVEKAIQDETIEEEQIELVQSALEFTDTKVAEVFTPKEKMFAINIKGLNHQTLQEILANTKYSRIPLYDKVFDNMIGVLNVKVYFEEVTKDPHVDIRSIAQRPYFVSKDVMIDDLFEGFRRRRSHLAFVRDSHKKVIGMVTMEDVLEELVEDISEPVSQKGVK